MRQRFSQILTVLLLLGTLGAGFFGLLCKPPAQVSPAERRTLAALPSFTAEKLLSGRYVSGLTDYVQDQFPLRDGLRTVAAASRLYLFRQGDSNGLTPLAGAIYEPLSALDADAVRAAAKTIAAVADSLPEGVRAFYAVIPEKSGYVADALRRPVSDLSGMRGAFSDALGGDITELVLSDCLDETDYYRTDTHWRQEQLGPVVDRIAEAMGLPLRFADSSYEQRVFSPFYGVLYGRLALPVPAEALVYLTNDAIESAVVYNHETGRTEPVYRPELTAGMDAYDLFLGGAAACLTVTNEQAATDRRLLLFRDSYGSSLAPLLLAQYRQIVLIDLRYLPAAYLDRFIAAEPGDDVLFLYSALILNNGRVLR